MRKVFRSGALALVGLAAAAAPVMAATALPVPASAASGSHATSHATAGTPAAPGHIVPGLYHVPIIGKQALPGLGSLLGGERHATAVSSANWAGYADTNDTYTSVSSSWTEPEVSCSSSGGGLSLGLDGLTGIFNSLLGGPSSASAFWVGLDGYSSTSVEQIGTDSDCDSGTPSYYAWYEMYPNPSVTLPTADAVNPGDHLTALVASNAAGTSFTLVIKDTTAGWSFSTTQTGSGYARSSAEVIAEAPSECTAVYCSEIALADFGQVGYSGSSLIDTAAKVGSLSAFNANEITMSDDGTTLATPSSLSSDGSSFSVTWNNS
jgi:hypothetical protein